MLEKSIDVSIIVAIYNVEKYLRNCLESISRQDYISCEFILVDDGSTDSSGVICDEFVKKDHRFSVIHKQNEGVVRARHIGIVNARGKYIYVVDGDDWMDAGVLSVLMKNQKEYNADLIVCNYCKSYGLNEQCVDNLYTGLMIGDALTSFKKEFISKGKLYNFGLNPSLWNKLFERERILKIYERIPSEISIGEDLAVTVPYVAECSSIFFVNTDQVYHYQIRTDSLTHKYDPKLIMKVTCLKAYFDSWQWPLEISRQLDKYWAMIATMLIDNQISGNKNAKDRKNNILKMYDIDGLQEAILRIPQCDYTLRFKMLLFPFIRKNYTALKMVCSCDVCMRKLLRFFSAVKRRLNYNKLYKK
mgnify:CR=1 FL=1